MVLDTEAAQLPSRSTEDPQKQVWDLCNAFMKDIDEFTCGYPSKNIKNRVFLQLAEPHYLTLMNEIFAARPKFKVSQSTAANGSLPDSFSSGTTDPPGSFAKEDDAAVGTTQESGTSEADEITLDEIRATLKEAKCRELPGIVPYPVHEYYIKEYISQWQEYSVNCFKQAHLILRGRVSSLINKHFKRFTSSGLHSAVWYFSLRTSLTVRTVANELLSSGADCTLKELQCLCRMELHRPYTSHTNVYMERETEFLLYMKHKNPEDLTRSTRSSLKSPRTFMRTLQFPRVDLSIKFR